MTSPDSNRATGEPGWLERLVRRRWARWLLVLLLLPTLGLIVLGF